ncbi:hypothetical protein KIN20_016274 [Parelaphostrongylus tenuis]|uniref:Clusterin-associated protein 1 n=1 Tax=Parelaphostrongylus tenuis TaxID=148309 RepID=A0AAD5QMV2_PARTN|nr:hypothetical protein KIN20_016274 [Parelaphostrongylus tenuis]
MKNDFFRCKKFALPGNFRRSCHRRALHCTNCLERNFITDSSVITPLSRTIPLAEAEKTVQNSIEAIVADTEDITNKLSNVSSDEAALDEKIERKTREYEQMQKRYVKLQSFRPQYMDEYERLESKLKELYEIYVVKFRNLAYLQQLQLDIERSDRQKQEESERTMRQVVEKMRMELSMQEDPAEDEVPPINQARQDSSRKVFGNMTGAGMSEDEDEENDPQATDVLTDSEEDQGKRLVLSMSINRITTINRSVTTVRIQVAITRNPSDT